MRYPLGKRRVKAVATLFDSRHVEARRIRNCLDVGGRGEIGIGSGDCRKLPGGQPRYSLGKRETRVEVRVVCPASVTGPPTSVQGELHEICKP